MSARRDLLGRLMRPLGVTLSRLPTPLVLALGVALLALIADMDERTGPVAGLSLLYVLPIALVTWFVGGFWGVVFAAFGGVAAFAFNHGVFPRRLDPAMSILGVSARIASFGVVAWLIWTLRRAMENQRSLANTDEMTAIGNARAFRFAAAREIARARRQATPLTAVYLDCDDFKAVNDRFGHAAGDRVLRTLASTLAAHVRATDHVARLGGDEFALLLPETGAPEARTVVEKLRRLLANAFHNRPGGVTVSLGVATFDPPPESVDEMLAIVDALQYRAKSLGKNAIVYDTLRGLAHDTPADPPNPLNTPPSAPTPPAPTPPPAAPSRPLAA